MLTTLPRNLVGRDIVIGDIHGRFSRDEEIRSLAVSGRSLVRQAWDLGTPGIERESRLDGIDWVIHGHTPRGHCRVGQLGNRLWIDTMGWYDEEVERGTQRFTLVDARDPRTPL